MKANESKEKTPPQENVYGARWKRRRGMVPQFKRILYATDLSKNSTYAFLYAIDMAKKHNARIVILHSIESGRHISYAGSGVEGMMRRAKEQELDINPIDFQCYSLLPPPPSRPPSPASSS
jgi:hypothetical protein